MNSFNHYAYGAAAAWVYQYAAGIKPLWEAPGFRKFILAPQPGGSLEHLSVEFASPAGLIRSAWQRKANQITYRFTVPAGTSAELQLPETAKKEVLTGGEYTFTFPCQ
jgi:alpha-L-rhamnosidase